MDSYQTAKLFLLNVGSSSSKRRNPLGNGVTARSFMPQVIFNQIPLEVIRREPVFGAERMVAQLPQEATLKAILGGGQWKDVPKTIELT